MPFNTFRTDAFQKKSPKKQENPGPRAIKCKVLYSRTDYSSSSAVCIQMQEGISTALNTNIYSMQARTYNQGIETKERKTWQGTTPPQSKDHENVTKIEGMKRL